MFTGLVGGLGVLASFERDEQGAQLEIATALAAQLREGDSVAVNGVCLTATLVGAGVFRAQAMRETLQRSALEGLQVGSQVNLELPLRAEDRLGGHVVQGHVDGTATVRAIREEGFSRVLKLECEQRLLRYLGAPHWLRALNWLWCLGILYSTLATKQHVAIDLYAGVALGLAVALLRPRPVLSPLPMGA